MKVQLRGYALATVFAVMPIFGSQGTGSMSARTLHADSGLFAPAAEIDAADVLERADGFIVRSLGTELPGGAPR